ncbi:HAD family hydrolase [[Mycobacterium] vasticus]|uniref:HAD family hydrolase n=1 Tax=[Mycobacterium] vasticus TaxID=2875777 RepID=A0ABU5YZZ7_9MYCO|nr:HAD family hydrolase [Mycolicibacter sp. MYC017]MEB3070719.1 HAD family hydrolase [Mycolicibacter sp. MYC017]
MTTARGDGTTWLFDVDGTLVDGITGLSLRPGARELLTALRQRGIGVLLWSAGGAAYALRRAEQNGIDDLVDAAYDKERDEPSLPWRLPADLVARPPVVLVDDMPDEVPRVGEVVAVRRYLGPNPHDTALVQLMTRLGGH